MAALNEPTGDAEWPQRHRDGWRTAAGWLWLGYFLAHALLGVWLLG
jgi:hypothetical protein